MNLMKQVSNFLKQKGYNDDQIERIFSLSLPKGYVNLSIEAMKNIIPYLKLRQKYDEAAKSAGYQHSTKFTGEIFDEGNLPYYGELLPHRVIKSPVASNQLISDQKSIAFYEQKFGKINNPSVHIALNQTQKLINALSKKYGGPVEIVVELARELTMSLEKYKEFEKKQKINTLKNEKIRNILADNGIDASRENILKYQLWEELNPDIFSRCCVYSGRLISFSDLYTNDIEVEHILPFKRTYDDSRSNKTLSYSSANRFKDNKTPYEAFSDAREYCWSDILARAEYLPYTKRKRFSADAMDRFQEDSDPIARMLTDTQYMSRIAAEYLKYVCGKVSSVKGSVTASLRHMWGLNSILGTDNTKNRNDHRHHAVDAFAIACSTHLIVKTMAHYQFLKSKDRPAFLPFANYDREKLIKKVNQIYVSFKPEQPNPKALQKYNQTAGQLVEDTAWNYHKPLDKQYALFTIRKSIDYFVELDKCEKIIDSVIRQKLISFFKDNGKIDIDLLNEWTDKVGIKKIKISDKMGTRSMIPVADKNGKFHKFYSSAENLYSDVYLEKPWDPDSNWGIEHITSYNAHQKNFVPEWKKTYPFAKLLFRVYKNDYIILTEYGTDKVYRIKKMSKKTLYLEDIYKSISNKDNPFVAKRLKSLKARKGGVDIIGRLNDPMRE